MPKLGQAVWLPYCLIAGTLAVTVVGGKGCAADQNAPSGKASRDDRQPIEARPAAPGIGEAEVFTGTRTPHPQKDSPVKTDRITDDTLEQAGATHIGQSLQDLPGLQPGRR